MRSRLTLRASGGPSDMGVETGRMHVLNADFKILGPAVSFFEEQ